MHSRVQLITFRCARRYQLAALRRPDAAQRDVRAGERQLGVQRVGRRLVHGPLSSARWLYGVDARRDTRQAVRT